MYTVLIAEDELLVRIGIASCVPWDEMNVRLIGEVEDGESAWALYEKHRPDIVITDILMPKVDGLELLQRIRSTGDECAVIAITNVVHNETLREAKELGITDVLLKASMKQEDIRLAVEKACLSLDKDRKGEEKRDESALWRAALLDGEDPKGLFDPHALVMLHVFPSDKLSHRLKESLINLTAHEFGEQMDYCSVRTDTGAFFVFRRSFDASEQAAQLAELQQYVWDVFQVRIGFARVLGACDVPRLRQIYRIMRRLSASEPFFISDMLSLDISGAYMAPALQSLFRRMSSFSCLQEKFPQLKDFAAALSQYPGNLNDGWTLVRNRGEKVLAVMGIAEQCDSLSLLTRRICECGEALADQIAHSLKPEILTVIAYVDEHLEEELSISQISALIGYQSKYFSRLFKHEMGCNYTDFLTQQRIGRARELLTETTLPVQEIAKKCGFSEVSYFSSRFKQFTGMTPKQIRTVL